MIKQECISFVLLSLVINLSMEQNLSLKKGLQAMKPYFNSVLYIILLALISPLSVADEELNVYSARKEAYIKPLLDQFATAHQVKVNLVTSKADALIERLINEGDNTPADVLITVDAGRLHRAKSAGVLKVIDDETILQSVPEQYRDSEGYWLGLSVRVRAIVFNNEKVIAKQISSYEDLAESKWQKRICIRSSNNIYNQSLVASLIAHHGIDFTQDWANKFVTNFARKPQGGDRDQIKAVAIGQCDLAVVNSYYLGKMLTGSNEEKAAAEKVDIFWPNQGDRGAHVNISGIGITAYGKHEELARQLIKFLLTDQSQEWYGKVNLEYPVREKINTNEILQQWGRFKADILHLEKLGELNASAVQLMDRAQWR